MSLKTTAVLTALLFSTSAMADVTPCMVGTWQVDLDDMAHVFATQMGANNVLATGNVTLLIGAGESATMTVRNLRLDMDMAGVPPIQVTLNGATTYQFSDMGDGIFTVSTTAINLVATADVLGSTMEIPFSSAEGLFGGGFAEFGCRANSMSVESGDPPKFPRHWTR